MKKKISFEQALQRLEELADILERGELPLADSLKLYEEGAQLAAFCSKELADARQKIIDLSEKSNDNE